LSQGTVARSLFRPYRKVNICDTCSAISIPGDTHGRMTPHCDVKAEAPVSDFRAISRARRPRAVHFKSRSSRSAGGRQTCEFCEYY